MMNRVLVGVTGVLEVLLTSDLSFQPHVAIFGSQAFKMLGFIKGSCTGFQCTEALKSLNVSLFSSKLVWSSHAKTQCQKIERVQTSFLRFFYVSNLKSVILTLGIELLVSISDYLLWQTDEFFWICPVYTLI